MLTFYSHMLHFALNVQVILPGQNQKVESAPTVMYCILSSFIQENTRELSVNNLQPLLIGYLFAVIYKEG